MALTKVTYSMIEGDPVNVLDFGADPTGVTDSTVAIQAAIDSVSDDNVVVIPPGTYELSDTLTLGVLNKGARIVGLGLPTLNFVGLGATKDGIQVVGANYRQTEIRNLNIDLNGVGRDGIRLQAGDHPYMSNVYIYNTGRHGLALICDAGDWVENGVFKEITTVDVGASGYFLNTSGSGGAFINECIFETCEVRGVSLLSNDGAAVYAVSAGTTAGSKMSNIRWVSCNFDAQRQKSIDNGFDVNPNPMFLKYTVGATNSYESWHIDTGGWETTSANPDYRRPGLVYCENLAIARGFNIQNIVPGGWSGGGYYNLVDYVVHDVQYGTFRPQYPNSWTAVDLSASATTNVDVGFPNQLIRNVSLNRLSIGAAYKLHFFHTTFAGNEQEVFTQEIYLTYFVSGADVYGVLYGATSTTLIGIKDQFTVNSVTVLNASGGATLNAANPPAIIRINVTTTADYGAGGGDTSSYAIVQYIGAAHGNYGA